MHRSPGAGSVSKAAADHGRARGIAVIDSGSPCMFGPTGDLGHKVMRHLFTLTGNVPKEVATAVDRGRTAASRGATPAATGDGTSERGS